MGVKTTVEIAAPLLAEAKALARATNQTLRDLIETGLQRVLADRRQASAPFVMPDCSVGHGGVLHPDERWDDGHAMRMYCYMGRDGVPDTIEAINEMLDDDAAAAATAPAGGIERR